MYQEQDLAADTVRFWHELAGRKLFDQVLLVTTAKETPPQQGVTTRDLVEAELARLAADPDDIALLHCEQVTRFRASQLNLAVEHARSRFASEAGDPANIWIGVYNADSRPSAETFIELADQVATEQHVRLFQQLVDYVVPTRGDVELAAVGNSVLQTWWTMAHYVNRNRRGYPGDSMWSRTAPYSTFGHGEFARLDFLDHIGGFPDFAYADGLLLGWIARLAAEPIGLLAARDVAEVPRSAKDLFTQQSAWLRGLLNFDATVRWCREQGVLRLSAAEVRLLQAQHLAIPVTWGLSTAALAAGIVTLSRRVVRGEASLLDLVALGGLVTYPVIPALLPTAGQHRTMAVFQRIVGTLTSWPVEGLALWPALRAHLRREQQAPAKTPR